VSFRRCRDSPSPVPPVRTRAPGPLTLSLPFPTPNPNPNPNSNPNPNEKETTVPRFLERHAPVLFVGVLAAGLVALTSLPATAQADSDRLDHLPAVRPVAAPGPPASPRLDRAALEALLANAYSRLAAANLPAPEAPPSAASDPTRSAPPPVHAAPADAAPGAPARGSCQGDVDCFLACTRAHESDSSGGYGAVSGSGSYRGAYQFSQSTWNAAVAGAGFAEYVGTPADQAPAEVQDAAAAQLYSVSGNSPWGGLC